jgi:hypothetical protein
MDILTTATWSCCHGMPRCQCLLTVEELVLPWLPHLSGELSLLCCGRWLLYGDVPAATELSTWCFECAQAFGFVKFWEGLHGVDIKNLRSNIFFHNKHNFSAHLTWTINLFTTTFGASARISKVQGYQGFLRERAICIVQV